MPIDLPPTATIAQARMFARRIEDPKLKGQLLQRIDTAVQGGESKVNLGWLKAALSQDQVKAAVDRRTADGFEGAPAGAPTRAAATAATGAVSTRSEPLSPDRVRLETADAPGWNHFQVGVYVDGELRTNVEVTGPAERAFRDMTEVLHGAAKNGKCVQIDYGALREHNAHSLTGPRVEDILKMSREDAPKPQPVDPNLISLVAVDTPGFGNHVARLLVSGKAVATIDMSGSEMRPVMNRINDLLGDAAKQGKRVIIDPTAVHAYNLGYWRGQMVPESALFKLVD